MYRSVVLLVLVVLVCCAASLVAAQHDISAPHSNGQQQTLAHVDSMQPLFIESSADADTDSTVDATYKSEADADSFTDAELSSESTADADADTELATWSDAEADADADADEAVMIELEADENKPKKSNPRRKHAPSSEDSGKVSSSTNSGSLADAKLPVKFARAVGKSPLSSSLPGAVSPDAASESPDAVTARYAAAATQLQALTEAERKQQQIRADLKLHEKNYDAAVKKARQSREKGRAVRSKRMKHPYYARDAVAVGDRNLNTLFPAATPASDGWAPANSQQDFHHRGDGDHLSSEHLSALGSVGPQSRDPCAAKCNVPLGWQQAGCQDCILRGMVNGWILRSIQDAQKGYNYAHWSRNQCVKYAKKFGAGANGNAAPFADCWFQQMHETCNL